MRLIMALENLRFLLERIPPRNWGEAPEGRNAEPVRCGFIISRQYIFDGNTGEIKLNKKGEPIEHVRRCRNMAVLGFGGCSAPKHGGPKNIKPATRGTKVPDPMRLVVLAADITREIDALPPRPRRLFELLYRDPLPLGPKQTLQAWYDDKCHDRYVEDVKRRMGYTEPAAYTLDHDSWVAQMEWTLIDHFPEARYQA